MDKVYLIIRTDFDNLEDHDPYKTNILGYAETEEHATAVVKSLEISEPKYKGWNFSWAKQLYPQFSIKTIKKY